MPGIIVGIRFRSAWQSMTAVVVCAGSGETFVTQGTAYVEVDLGIVYFVRMQ